MQTVLLRLHEERKARLIRMKAWQSNIPIVKAEIPKAPIVKPKIVLPKVEKLDSKPPRYKGWFWPLPKPEHPEVRHILEAVCSHYKIDIEQVKSPSRDQISTRPRMVTAYLARELTTASLGQIGQALRKDHKTVLHAWQKLGKTAAKDGEIQQILKALTPSEN